MLATEVDAFELLPMSVGLFFASNSARGGEQMPDARASIEKHYSSDGLVDRIIAGLDADDQGGAHGVARCGLDCWLAHNHGGDGRRAAQEGDAHACHATRRGIDY
jgi:hypothetical protein